MTKMTKQILLATLSFILSSECQQIPFRLSIRDSRYEIIDELIINSMDPAFSISKINDFIAKNTLDNGFKVQLLELYLTHVMKSFDVEKIENKDFETKCSTNKEAIVDDDCIPGMDVFEHWVDNEYLNTHLPTSVCSECLESESVTCIGSALTNFCLLRNETRIRKLWVIGKYIFGSESNLLDYLQNHARIETVRFKTTAVPTLELMVFKFDSWSVTEHVFLEQDDDVYKFKENMNSDATGDYLDIGGHIGVSILFATYLNPQFKRIITLEPTPQNYFCLRYNLLMNLKQSSSSLIIIPLQAGLTTHRTSFPVTWRPNDSSGSSMLNGFGFKPDDIKQNVQGLPINKIIDIFNIQNISLLKLDCEGCENVLPSWQKELTNNITRICGEWHPWLFKHTSNDIAIGEMVWKSICAFPKMKRIAFNLHLIDAFSHLSMSSCV